MVKYPLGIRFHYDHVFLSDKIDLGMVSLTQIGEICLEESFTLPVHKQRCLEISYIILGKGIFEVDGQKISVKAGDIVFTPDSGKHCIYASNQESIFYSYIGFSMTDKMPEYLYSFFSKRLQSISKDQNGIYDTFRKCMDEFYSSDGIDKLLVESYIMQIIILSRRSLMNSHALYEYDSPMDNPGQLVYKIMKYINHNIFKQITVTQIADNLGYSTYYISHVFKIKMKCTLQSYIAISKVEKAKELMRLDRFTVTEISEKLGYINIQSFSRVFKKTTGIYPSVFIKDIRQNALKHNATDSSK